MLRTMALPPSPTAASLRAISRMRLRTSCFFVGIEAVGWFVHDEDPGLVDDGLCQADAALEALLLSVSMGW